MKVVTFGEIMLRLSPPGYMRFGQTDTLEAVYGGGEANVAVSLANFGLHSVYITKLPDNDIGQGAINSIRRYGVDTSCIPRGGDRVGIYYTEKGASQRPSKVIYDRAHSSIAEARSEDFNWKEIFSGASWFHYTGITPALGENIARITEEACIQAKKSGAYVSCDLNYRKKLWTPEQADKTMSRLMQYTDVCIANEEDAEKVFGIKAEGTDVSEGLLVHKSYEEVAHKLIDRFGFKQVAITLRTSISASNNRWSAMLCNGHDIYTAKEYDMTIIDRIGGGDSFASGIIYGILSGYDPQKTVNFACAASCLKHSICGDFNLVSVQEVESLVEGDASGRVRR